jgi:hypothetical protein
MFVIVAKSGGLTTDFRGKGEGPGKASAGAMDGDALSWAVYSRLFVDRATAAVTCVATGGGSPTRRGSAARSAVSTAVTFATVAIVAAAGVLTVLVALAFGVVVSAIIILIVVAMMKEG